MFIRLITWNNILAPYLGYVRLKLQISIQQKHFRQFFFFFIIIIITRIIIIIIIIYLFSHTLLWSYSRCLPQCFLSFSAYTNKNVNIKFSAHNAFLE